jgi:hypothetical protein
MKSMKNIAGYLLTAGSMFAIFSSAYADGTGELINIEFIPLRTNTYHGSAAQGNSGTLIWNEFQGISVNPAIPKTLKNSTGDVTGSIYYSFGSLTKSNTDSAFTALENILMGGYLLTYTSGSVNVSGLDPESTYKVYVYTQGLSRNASLNNQKIQVAVNGEDPFTQTFASDTSLNHFVLGQNVVTSLVNTNASGQLNMVFTPMSGSNVVILNALQIEAVDMGGFGGDPVPEPGTMVLLSVGGLAFMAYVRLKSKDNHSVNV